MRNKVLDLLRGHYLVAILIDHFHLYPSPFQYYNGKGDLWVSAATGFVFLSGMLLGMVHFPKIESKGMSYVARRLVTRGIKLHLIGVFLTTVYSMAGLYLGTAPYLGNGITYTTLPSIVWQALIFNYTYGWADLLIFYAVLLLASPIIILAIYKGYWKVVLLLSALAWSYEFHLAEHIEFTASTFPVIAWQFLFIIGMVVGCHKSYFSKLYRSFLAGDHIYFRLMLALAFVVTLYLSYLDNIYGYFDGITKELLNLYFSKLSLGPARLIVFFIWFSFFYWFFDRFIVYIERYAGWLFYTFGKNSLLTYGLQSVVLFAAFYITFPSGYIANTLGTIAIILCVWLLVKLARSKTLSWIKV